MNKAQERDDARELFFQSDHSQAEIARKVGVEPKTVNLWVKNGKWKELKEAARRTPAILVDQYLYQLSQLNRSIEERPDGQRFPDLKEAETMRKLIVCINGIQKQASLSANIEVVQNFIGRINSTNNDLAKQLIGPAENFLFGKEKNGCHSFDLGYDIPDEVAAPVEEELEHSQSIPCPANSAGVNEESLNAESLDLPQAENIDIPLSEHSQSIVNEESLNGESIVPVFTIGDAILYSDGTIRHIENEVKEMPPQEDELSKIPYTQKSWKDPDDPFTTYYANGITKRQFGSPKYGLPPEGFRECPPTKWDNYSRKGFDRYGWPTDT